MIISKLSTTLIWHQNQEVINLSSCYKWHPLLPSRYLWNLKFEMHFSVDKAATIVFEVQYGAMGGGVVVVVVVVVVVMVVVVVGGVRS